MRRNAFDRARPRRRSAERVSLGIFLAGIGFLAACATAEIKGEEAFLGPLVPSAAPSGATVQPSPPPAGVSVGDPSPTLPAVGEDDRWRFGFSLPEAADAAAWAETLGAAWYLDWGAGDHSSPPGLAYWRIVRVRSDGITPSLEVLKDLARRYPGETWIVGNEPDVIWQDNVEPELFALRYGEVYAALKAADPEARVAVGAVAQVTPLRLEYLERALVSYQERFGQALPADLWTIHTYILPEDPESWGIGLPPGFQGRQGLTFAIADHDRVDLLDTQLVTFRRWLAGNGYRELPLVLTEFGVLIHPAYGFTPDRVAAYLQTTFRLLLSRDDPEIGLPSDGNRLVQQWAWFSLSYGEYPTGNLADLGAGALTPIGEAYRDFVLGAR